MGVIDVEEFTQSHIERGFTWAEIQHELRLAREEQYRRSPAVLATIIERTVDPRLAWESLKRYFGNNSAKKVTTTKK